MSTIFSNTQPFQIEYIWLSDTAFHFAPEPILNCSSLDVVSSTGDSGIIIVGYNKIDKYDKHFNKQWTTPFRGNTSSQDYLKILESRNGGYYIVSSGVDIVTLNKHPEYNNSASWDCYQDIILSYIDASGKLIFSANYGTDNCSEDPYSMIQDLNDGGIIITGDYGLSKVVSSCDELCDKEKYTNWIFKVDSLGQPAKRIISTGIEEKTGDACSMRLFPNPVLGILNVEFGRAGYFTDIEILDIMGKVLYTSKLENNGQFQIILNVSAFESGAYFCRLRADSQSITRQFIIQR